MKNNLNIIKKLELELLKPEVRKNKKRLGELISNDFIEFTSVGTIIGKKDALKSLPKENLIEWKVSNFKIKAISQDIVLATYKVQKIDLKKKKIIISLRSSLWRNISNSWQIVFHQGTKIPPPSLPLRRVREGA